MFSIPEIKFFAQSQALFKAEWISALNNDQTQEEIVKTDRSFCNVTWIHLDEIY